jgi:MerR family redox-sensitive transcriptional activator SoxR
MVQVLRFAQQAGFTLEEIKTLFSGLESGTAFGDTWRSLAQSKLEELDALVASAQRMRHAIELGLQCGCIRLEDCTLPEQYAAAMAGGRKETTGNPRA